MFYYNRLPAFTFTPLRGVFFSLKGIKKKIKHQVHSALIQLIKNNRKTFLSNLNNIDLKIFINTVICLHRSRNSTIFHNSKTVEETSDFYKHVTSVMKVKATN